MKQFITSKDVRDIEHESGPFSIKLEDDYGGGVLSSFPGCSGIIVSHGAYVIRPCRGLGHGDRLHKERLEWAENNATCGLLIATVVVGNKAEEHILINNNWVRIHEFVNPITKNIIGVWVRNVHQKSRV